MAPTDAGSLIITIKGSLKEVIKALAQTEKRAEKSGSKAGKGFADKFAKRLDALNKLAQLKLGKLGQKAFGQVGEKAVGRFGERLGGESQLRKGGGGKVSAQEAFFGIVNQAGKVEGAFKLASSAIDLLSGDADKAVAAFKQLPFGIGAAIGAFEGLVNKITGFDKEIEGFTKQNEATQRKSAVSQKRGALQASGEALAEQLENQSRLLGLTGSKLAKEQAAQFRAKAEERASVLDQGFGDIANRIRAAAAKQADFIAKGGRPERGPSSQTISLSRTAFGGPGGTEMVKPINQRQGVRIIELLEQGNTQGATAG